MEENIYLDLLGILGIIVLVLANGFFVAAEFALVSVRRTRIAELAARGEAGAEAVQKALENPDRVIAATQLGITMASLALGWVGEPALSGLFRPLMELFPIVNRTEVSHSLSAGLSFALITFITVVAGELAPKSIALQDPERTSLFVAGPTLFTERLFKPVIWLLNGAGNILLKILGIRPASGHQLVHSVEELKMIVSASADGGVVQADEKEMLDAIFSMGDMLVRQVMIPRTEMIAIEAQTLLSDVIHLATQVTYSKFPVYEDSLDQTVGVLHVKDLLKALSQPAENIRLARDLIREPLFVPETITVRALLYQFRSNRQHIAIVLDEYGGTSGLVTLEDLLEEIVGEVSDPFDQGMPEFETLPDGSILIDGLALIDEVNEHLKLTLSEPNYDTIAGYILGKLGRIPRLNDQVEGDGVRLRVHEMDGLRIARVALVCPPASETQADPAGSAPPDSG